MSPLSYPEARTLSVSLKQFPNETVQQSGNALLEAIS
jgi:hypothetical protein